MSAEHYCNRCGIYSLCTPFTHASFHGYDLLSTLHVDVARPVFVWGLFHHAITQCVTKSQRQILAAEHREMWLMHAAPVRIRVSRKIRSSALYISRMIVASYDQTLLPAIQVSTSLFRTWLRLGLGTRTVFETKRSWCDEICSKWWPLPSIPPLASKSPTDFKRASRVELSRSL